LTEEAEDREPFVKLYGPS